MEYLSNIELYYSSEIDSGENIIILTGDEFHHAVKVMRNKEGSEIYITDGVGSIYTCKVTKIFKDYLKAQIEEKRKYENKFSNVTFCFPVLKNPDRFKFALEKCSELGITNFIIFNSARSVAKIKRTDKWDKTLLAAMKQSLQAYLPKITASGNIEEILSYEGEHLLFEQRAGNKFSKEILKPDEKYYFVFGPEGGFTNEEISLFKKKYKLAENRLRSETAIINCASIISQI